MRKIISIAMLICMALPAMLMFSPTSVKAGPSVDISAQYSSFVSAYNHYTQIFGQDVSIGQTVDRSLSGVINDPLPHYEWRSWAGQIYPGMDGFSIRTETIQSDYVYKIIGMGYMAGSQPSASGWVQVNSPYTIEQINYVQNVTYGGGSYVYIHIDKSTGRVDFNAQWTNWPALIDAPAFEFAFTIAKPGGALPAFSYDTTRTRAAYAYDTDIKQAVMFGGYSQWNGTLNPDLWTFNPTTSQWSLVSTTNQPLGRSDASLSYDTYAKNLVTYGGGTISGETGETWIFQFSGSNAGTWTQLPISGPLARFSAPMVYDSKNDLCVLFGGGQYVYSFGDTWTFNPSTSTWSNPNPSPSPPQRLQPGMAYDAKSGKVLLFGGLNKGAGSLLSDTWLYDVASNAWQQITTANAPSARLAPSLACDANGVFYLFGGWNIDANGLSQYLDDTWKFDMTTMQWTQLTPAKAPIGQSQAAFMNLGGGRFALINGWRDSPLGEIWFYDSQQDTWSTQIRQRTKWAVILGDNEYKYSSDNGRGGPVNSANDMYNLLVNKFNFPPANVRLRTDAVRNSADDINTIDVENELNWLIENVIPGDTAVFYYAGHGSQGTNGMDYLVAHDEIGLNDSAFTGYVNKINTDKLLVILDMSFSGGFITDGQTALQGLQGNFASYTDLAEGKPSGRIVLTGCAQNTSCPLQIGRLQIEIPGARDAKERPFWYALNKELRYEMVFTHYLVEGFNGNADSNHDSIVTVEEAFYYARSNAYYGGIPFPRLAGLILGQTPMMYDGYPAYGSSGDLYLG